MTTLSESIASAEIAQARTAARAARRRVVDVLEETLSLDPDTFTARLAATLRVERLDMADLRLATPAFDVLPFGECSQHGCALLRASDGRLMLAFDDPFSGELHAWAEERISQAFSWCLVHRGDLVAFLAGHEESLRALDAVEGEVSIGPTDTGRVEDLSLKAIGDESSEVVRLVRSTLRDALMLGASDIHLETLPSGLTIKFRIDGILSQVKAIQDARQAEQAIARVKVLAELDITERRVPQDGRFKALERGRAVDFRVSIMPSIHGEDAVLRVLDKQSLYETTHQQLSLDSLGLEAAEVKKLRRLSNEPYGMLLVTGPTGSGKTTTLYAALSKLYDPSLKIITIEDPVEYELSGINQIPVNPDRGLMFSTGLRAILRQDPDVVMIGEIRDLETATIATNASLTGHLVFSTLHTNDAPSAVARLVDIGVQPFLVASSVRAIMAQRLVRRLCGNCKQPGELSETDLRALNLEPGQLADAQVMKPVGCEECRGTGYKGRMGIFEIFVLDDNVRHMINNRRSTLLLRQRARELGMRTLREDGVRKVLAGVTSAEEVISITLGDVS